MPSLAEIQQYLGGQVYGKPFLPDVNLSGKTYVITGANTGLGLECAKQLTALNASRIILGCRNLSKGEAAKKSVRAISTTATVEVWQVDLTSYASTLAFGARFKSLDRLDGFIANAGIETVTFEMAEDFEKSLTVNVVSTVLVVILALSKLKETASVHDCKANLVIVGSMQHIFAPVQQLLDVPEGTSTFDHLTTISKGKMQKRYELTKLMVQMCEKELAARMSNSGGNRVVVNCVNPGWCATDLSRYYDKGRAVGAIFSMIGRTAEAGGRTLTHAVTAGMETHGHYLSECQVKTESNFVRSKVGEAAQKRLWADLSVTIESLSPGAMAEVC